MEKRRRNKGGWKLGHITALKAVYFSSLASFPSFCHSVCQVYFFLSLPFLIPSHVFKLSVVVTVCSCLLWFPYGFIRERDRERRGRDDLVEEGMSLHAVIDYYFSSSALLFYCSPPHYSHPSEAPQQSHSSPSVPCLSLCLPVCRLGHRLSSSSLQSC